MTQYAKQSAEYVIPGIQSVKIHYVHSTISKMHHLIFCNLFLPSDVL
jgi:hypothetical protein